MPRRPADQDVVDILSPEMIRDPFPTFKRLRDDAPLSPVRSPLVRGVGVMLTRYDDVLAAHTDQRFSSDMMANTSPIVARIMPRLFRVLTDSMVFKDDPEHKRIRGLVSKAFTPKRVQQMGDEIEQIVESLTGDLARIDDPFDFVDRFAVALPLTVIARMLGIDERDREQFHADVRTTLAGYEKGLVGTALAFPSSRRLLRLFDRLAADRRATPDDGLITALLQAQEHDDRLGDDEVIAMIYLLLLAGHDTTSNLVSGGLLALLDHPDQLQRLRDEPELVDRAVEELLRFTSPVPVGATRYAKDDIELPSGTVPRGSQVLAMVIAANRDERVFDRPDDLDLGRDPNRHLAFAFGSHFCLGNQLARLEARAALGGLLRRFDRIELAVPRDQIAFRRSTGLRGPVRLPVRLTR